MNYDLLKTFLSLSETKNFNRTAELLFISQPTVTARIKALEVEVGQELFIRTNKFVELTPAGMRFLPYAMDMYKMTNECRTSLRNFDHRSEIITFSAPGTCWDYGPMKQSILDYGAKNKNVSLHLLRNVSVNTLSLLQSDQVDIGVVYVHPSNPDYTIIPYFSEELLLLASPEMHLPPQGDFLNDRKGPLPPMVSPTYAAIASQLVEDSLYMLPCSIYTDHPALHLEFVKQGFGIGLLQRTIAEESLASGDLVMVDCDYNRQPLLYKNFLVLHRKKEQRLQPLVDELMAWRYWEDRRK